MQDLRKKKTKQTKPQQKPKQTHRTKKKVKTSFEEYMIFGIVSQATDDVMY